MEVDEGKNGEEKQVDETRIKVGVKNQEGRPRQAWPFHGPGPGLSLSLINGPSTG